EKTRKKPRKSACVIAICMQRDPEERVPEWEELAAVACAVQNMWLTCTAYGIGAYWSSPKTIKHTNAFLQLAEGESCLGFFYMGYHDLPEIPGKRSGVASKVVWIDD
ncbi:MAG: nitroreductase family protein, partial [Bacteroidota bacterium]